MFKIKNPLQELDISSDLIEKIKITVSGIFVYTRNGNVLVIQ